MDRKDGDKPHHKGSAARLSAQNPTPENVGTEPVGETGARLAEAVAVEEMAARSEPHDPYAALRLPNYRNFAAGFVCSSTGLRMMSVAIGWEVYERTGASMASGAMALGVVGLVRAAPVLALALPAGHLIDVLDRKKVLVATQAGFAAATVVLALASALHAPLWVLYVLIGVTGCVRVFNGPSRAVLLPQIVPAETFHNAVTWNSGVFQFSALAGPMLAGWLIHATGEAWPVYLATACSCLVFAFTATLIRPRPHARAQGAAERFSFLGMFEGMKHVWREKTVLAAISLDLFAVLLGGATALMPVFARDILRVGPLGLGALSAAPYAGALLMALVIAHRPPFKRAGMAMLLSVAGFGGATIGFGLSTWFPLSLAMLALLGAFDNISVVIRHVLVQVRTPEHVRGRVSAVNSVFIESSNELGAFESGAVAALFGPVISVVAGGIGTIAVVLGIGWLWPEVRRLGELSDAGVKPPAVPPRSCIGCGRGFAGAGLDCPECGASNPAGDRIRGSR